MGTIDRFRMENKYNDQLMNELLGDDKGPNSDTLSTVFNMLSEGAQRADKAAADKRAKDAYNKSDEKKNKDEAVRLRKAATIAQIEADKMTAQANIKEPSGKGPEHDKAAAAQQQAKLADAEAKAAEAKAGMSSPQSPPAGGAAATMALTTTNTGGGLSSVPWWGWALGGVGVLGVGFVTYKAFKKK